jgi:hypothetical protein
MADDQDQQVQPQAGLANPHNLVIVNELKTLFFIQKKDHTRYKVTAKFMYKRIKIA